MTTMHARSGGSAAAPRRRGGAGRWATLATTTFLAGALVACGASAGADTLDADTLERDIASLLSDEGLEVDEVDCPADLAVADGDEFTCTATVAGSQHRIDARRDGDDIAWETAGVVVDRATVADIVTTEAAEAGYEVVVECGEDDEPDVFIADAGHSFYCGAADVATGEATAIEIVVDPDQDVGFTWEAIGDAIPGNEPGDQPGDDPGDGTGEVVLDDDFSDDRNDWNPEGVSEGGAYYVDITGRSFEWAVYEQLDFWLEWYPNVLVEPGARGELDDVRVEATLVSEGAKAEPGVICRAVDDLGTGYIALVRPDGSASIRKWGPDGLERLVSTHLPRDDEDPAELDRRISASRAHDWDGSSDPVTIALECEDGDDGTVELRLFVDDELVLEHVDDDDPSFGGTPSLFMAPHAPSDEELTYPFGISWKRFTVSTL